LQGISDIDKLAIALHLEVHENVFFGMKELMLSFNSRSLFPIKWLDKWSLFFFFLLDSFCRLNLSLLFLLFFHFSTFLL